MSQLQFECWQLQPLWDDYVQDARQGLSLLLNGLRGEIIGLEQRLEIQFGNPAVDKPAGQCRKIEQSLQKEWSVELAEMAILLGLRSLLSAYKTAAAHLIIEARKGIEACGSAGRTDLDSFMELHKEAREYYGKSKDVQIAQENESLHEIVERIDQLILNYCMSIGIALQAWCR